MATFPTTPILDTFSRGNSASLGANWTKDTNTTDWSDAMAITSNSAGDTSYSNGSAQYWNVSTFSGIIETYITLSTKGTNTWAGCGCSTGFSTENYYEVASDTSGTNVAIKKQVVAGNDVNLATFSQSLSSGDSLGMKRYPSGLIEAWYKPSGGAWTLLGTAFDSAFTCQYLMFSANDTTVRYINFGGGTAQVYSTTNTTNIYNANIYNAKIY